MLDETVDPVRQYRLEVALTGAAAGVRRHHPGHRGVGAEE